MPNEIYHRSHWGNANAEGFGDVYFDASATNKLYKHSDYYENSNGTDKILRDIPNKASIVLTPTAYSDGSLNTVIPPYQVSSELVTNGTFDTDSDWTKDAGWTISNGEAIHTGSGSYISQTGTTIGKNYIVVIEVTQASGSGFPQIYMGGLTTAMTSAGTYTFNITATSTLIRLRGVGDCKVSSISVKQVTEADFDFSRGSSATRVNEKGLIEDVQILSGELVQNGNFEQIGSELVTNGNFDTDTDWTKGTGWTIADGSASYDASGTSALTSASTSIVSGKIYRLKFKITTSGFARLNFTTDGSQSLFQPNGNSLNNFADGEYTFYLSAQNNSTALKIFAYNVSGGTSFSIDNISVKEVGQNWSFGSSWSMGDGVAISDGGASYLTSSGPSRFTSGKKYRVSLEIVEYNSGTVSLPFDASGVNANYQNSAGVKTADIIAINNNSPIYIYSSGFNGTIDNVSVKEVTDDTDLPRIDFTDGTGSLLLEPQRTNLVPYSEDFSQWLNSTSNLDVPSNVTQTNPSGGSESGFININNGVSATKFIYKSISTTSSIHTQSVFFKYHSRQWIQLLSGGTSHYANFDIQNGVVGNVSGCTATIEDYGSGWYRCTATLSSAGTPINLAITVIDDDATSRIPVSTGTGSYYVWGAQTEVGDYATSYIVSNSGSTTTRSADVANNSGNADLFNDSEGVLYAEIAALADDLTNRFISLTDGTQNNSVCIFYGGGSSNFIRSEIKSNNVTQAELTTTSYPITNYNKIAVSYAENNFALWVNGVKVVADTSGSTPIGLNNLSFNRANILTFFGKTKCVAVFKQALSDEELQALTS